MPSTYIPCCAYHVVYSTYMKKSVILIGFFVSILLAGPLFAAMTSDSYVILEDGFSAVESVTSTGGDFSLFDFSDTTPGILTADSLILHGGFYFPDATAFSMSVDSSSIVLGTLSQSSVASDSLTITITSGSGYTVSISEDGNLSDGTNDIDDVSDGTVSAGAEEYGIRTSGSAGLLASDTAINGSVNVMSGSSAVTNESASLIFSASIGSNSQAGSYSHTVTLTGTANP